MASRPAFIPSNDLNNPVLVENIEFDWHPGLAISQKQKSISSLHSSVKRSLGISKILDISSKSLNEYGVYASAFNLQVRIRDISSSVENLYQGSKVFADGGPYTDLYFKAPLEAKKDSRLKSSGNLEYFSLEGEQWTIQEDFYSWLYINGLLQNETIRSEIVKFDAFTDIEFNPKKSFNCQAYSAAMLTSAIRKKFDIAKLVDPLVFKTVFTKRDYGNKQLSFF